MQVNISSSLLFFILLISSNIVNVVGQSCKDQTGGNVAWWIIIKVPPKIGKSGFGYYDSRMTAVRFTYYDFHIDEGITPLTRTLSAINTASL